MKTALILTMLVTTGAFAQETSLPSLAEEASQLIRNFGETLSPDDQITVRRNLRHIVALFRSNGQTQPSGSFLCEPRTNKLIDLNTGALIFDFNGAGECNAARENVRIGKPFCVSRDNTLRSSEGLIFDFNNSPACLEAVESVYAYGKFCDYKDNTLRARDGRVLYDFNSSTQCRAALSI